MDELRKEKEMLERQLEYERVRLEAESRKVCLESQERLRTQLASSLSLNRTVSRQSSSGNQNLVGSLERSRVAMAEDLANLSAQNETLKKDVETIPPLKQKLQEVERNHEAMLQMYGEKAEEAEELKLDIDDLKAMYRQQIEELLSKRR